ncbi:histidine phosphatase family protein [Nonomuraea jabiensis]|uniref:Alpha-ribazole phosphatase/probable phosphoglycerate mutase n=1 Tax=Nonomuraea jabiensis TaxID=882448 RepID=A0A7W9LBA2_9ACTN|nr:histidine phosphatase family protein [Nonomuraea jabiensis]MBB5777283.1 alpha-ribazole phosphatase/probable phosphoglycerate mutase [Nonomuraea jabiensis]
MGVRVLCLRHAESENVVTRVSGALPSAELTPRGRAQAAETAERLVGEGVIRIYASTAVRARQTAGIIARALGVREVVALEELVEFGIGRLEGTADPAVRARTAEVLRSWVVEGRLDEAVADGETGHAVVTRMAAAFASIAATHPAQTAARDGGTVALVGHVGSLTAGLSVLCHGLGERVWGTPLPHAVPFPVEWDGRSWRCASWPALRQDR